MEERQKILAEALRKVLAGDRPILARHEDFLGAVEGKVPVAAIRDFRALENALKDSNLGEILLAADQKSPEEQQEALGKARELLLEQHTQERTVDRVLETLTDALDWGKKPSKAPAKPAPGTQAAQPPFSAARQPSQPAQPPLAAAPSAVQGPWNCVCGHQGNTGAFCISCGRPRAEGEQRRPVAPTPWNCVCGQKGNTGSFCVGCGRSRAEGERRQPVPGTAAPTAYPQRRQAMPAEPARVVRKTPRPMGQPAYGTPAPAKGKWSAEKKRNALIAAVVVLLGVLIFFGAREFGSEGASGTYASLGSKTEQAAKEAKTDLSLGGIDLGDDKSDLEKAQLGKENDTKEESGFIFHYYDDVQVATDGDEVVGLKSVSNRLATKRGIHQGDSFEEVKKAYGTDFKKAGTDDGLICYEYTFKTEKDEEGILRFAVRSSDQKVGYISARLTRYEKAKAKPKKQAAPADANTKWAQTALTNFYGAISRKDFSGAWRLMTPEQQSRMGSYNSFCQGYSSTLSSEAQNIAVASSAQNKVVLTYRLLARDRAPGGKVKVQVFNCTATLVPSGGEWKIIYTEAKQVSSHIE